MNAVFHRLSVWLWHLLPANPILVRVVHGASRRPRHLWLRAAYLAALLVVVLFSLVSSMSGRTGSLSELAKGASRTFEFASMAQLALMCFLAPVFTAAAITQERDAQTYNILLSTPLTNGQIVLGSLMSRLFFVIVLLLAGLPIFLITMVYGGVTTSQVIESFALSGATAILTGSLAIFVAMMRVGTRSTIFSFYLLIALYLVSVYLLGYYWQPSWMEESAANLDGRRMSWLTPLHPFLALDVSLNRVYAPPLAHLGDYPRWATWALAFPAAAYVTWTLMAASLLYFASLYFVRRGAKVGEMTLMNRILGRFTRVAGDGERKRAPRSVWSNPVAWREARTRAGGGAVLRWAIILGGIGGSLMLFVMYVNGSLTADEVRGWLAKLMVSQFAIALIIATNTAATSMTKERESKTMDILLTTPVTSRYILWGKLRGLVSFAAPLLLGPVVVVMLFGVYGLFQSESATSSPAAWIEVAPLMAAMMVIYTACACVIGLRISLVSRKNVTAVMYSVGAIVLLCGASWALGNQIVRNSGGEFGAFLAPFTPFTSLWYVTDPSGLFDSASELAKRAHAARTAAVIGSAIAFGLYAFVVWSVYSGLVRNFDMIVRRQSGT
ncbi:MAG: ABC transporter permease subunit [Phycisphaerae bacterium]|nr:ABC transporter permease subunit [Phycisphaerae bacterium]